MDAHSMLVTAAWLLGIAAVGGVAMALQRFGGRPRPPDWLAMLHGLLAAAALTLMIYAAVVFGVPPLTLGSIGLFVLAALGGLALNLMYHQKGIELPKTLTLGHGALAVVAYLLLLLSLRGGGPYSA